MNQITMDYLFKAEAELRHAKSMLEHCTIAGYQNSYGSPTYSHWKREALELMREVREIKTGKHSW